MKLVLGLTRFALILAFAFVASHGETLKKHKVTMTFVANEGTLIAGANVKLLVDGLLGKSYGIFQTPDAKTISKLISAEPPFDRLTAVLVTHKDLDHVNAIYVNDHLKNSPDCVLVAPLEVIELVRALPDFSRYESRAQSLRPTGIETETIVNQTKVRAIPLSHLPRPPQLPEMPYNVGYLFTIDGITFFHTGDMSAENLDSLQKARLCEAGIDVLLINWYVFKPEHGRLAQAMIQYLNPKVVLLAHLTNAGAPAEKALVDQMPGLPPIVALDTPMQTYEITKTEGSLKVSILPAAR